MAYPAPNIIPSGTTWAQLQAAGASGHLERLIAANAHGSNAPTVAATAAATGGASSGGSLAPGTYYFVFTETDGTGETTASPQGVQLTVATGNIPQITFPSLQAGNSARNLYLGAVGGPAGGPYSLYATGITTTTFNASAAAPTNSYAVKPPTINTTAFSYIDANGHTLNFAYQYIRAAKDGHLADVYRALSKLVDDYLRGDPASWSAVIAKLRHVGTTFATLATLVNEIGTLIDANAGTIKPTTNGIGSGTTQRNWP
jgi:hypothetical protein